MIDRDQYRPGPAGGAQIRKGEENWTLILVRKLRHPPAMVWQALTDPAHLSEWAPFDADRNLGAVRPVKLSKIPMESTLQKPARLKEWAYAGFAINLASALVAHVSVGDGPEAWGWAAGTGVLWGLSYFFWRRVQATPGRRCI